MWNTCHPAMATQPPPPHPSGMWGCQYGPGAQRGMLGYPPGKCPASPIHVPHHIDPPYPPKTGDNNPNKCHGPTMTTHGDKWHTAHPHPHKQLLVGWIAGGNGNNNDNRWCLRTPTTTGPSTTAMSNCSWGGNQAQWGWGQQEGTTLPPLTANMWGDSLAPNASRGAVYYHKYT